MATGGGKVAMPSFFKIFLPDVSSHRLPIPLAFSHYMKEKLPERGFLREHRNVWPVGLSKVDDQFFFNDGCEEFVEDHHIELGEMPFFQFDGHNFFDFKLLSLNACKKQIASPFSFNIKQEEEQEEDYDVEEEDDDKNDNHDDFHETEQREEEDEAESDGESIKEEKEEVEDDKNDDDDYFHETGQEEEEVAQGKAQKTEGSSRKRDMSSSIDDAAVFRSGKIALPKNPYFLVNFNRNRKEVVRRLQIPGYVIKDFDMKLQSKITIQDDEGRSWLSNVVKWRDGRVLLTTGWRKFCRWNQLEKGNLLLSEFDRSLCFLRIQILEFDGESWSPRPRNRCLGLKFFNANYSFIVYRFPSPFRTEQIRSWTLRWRG